MVPTYFLTVCAIHHRLLHEGKITVESSHDEHWFTFPGGREAVRRSADTAPRGGDSDMSRNP